MPETEDGLPILKKNTSDQTEDGLPILKKKELIASPLPLNPVQESGNALSVSEGGISGLMTTPSVSQDEYAQAPNLLTGIVEQPDISKSITAGQTTPQSLQSAQTVSGGNIPTGQKSIGGTTTGQDIANSLVRGSESLISGISKTPAFLVNTAQTTANKIMGQSENAGMHMDSENFISKSLDADIKKSQEQFQAKYDKDITDYFAEGNIDKGLAKMANMIAESAPVTISLIAGNAAGLGALGSTLAGGAVFGAEKKAELDQSHPEMDETKKNAIAWGSGLLEGVFENLPFTLTKMGGLVKNVFLESGEEAAKKVAVEGFKKVYGDVAKKYLGTMAVEPMTEMATQFGQNVIDKYSGVDPDLNLWRGVSDAGLTAVGQTASMHGAVSALSVAKTKSAVKQAQEIEAQKESIAKDIASPDVKPEAKTALSDKLHQLNHEDATLYETEKSKHEALPEEKKAEVDAVHQEINKISDAIIDPSTSKETKEIMKKDLDVLENHVEKIYEDSKKESDQKAAEEKVTNDIEKSFLETLKSEAPETKVEEAVQEPKVEPAKEAEQITENKTEETPVKETTAEQQPKTTSENKSPASPSQEDVVTPKKEKAVVTKELIDEEEQLEAQHEDDPDSIKKLNDDIAILKTFNEKDVSSKKFKAIIERAFKMKEEKKISKPTYTKYRNQASQVLGPKINLDAEEAKYKVESLKEEVKKKLLGEGYKKVIMSAPGFGPKQVADLIDLTAKLTNHAIDAGYAAKEAIEKALEHIKKHPHYNKLIEGGHLDEKEFSKQVKSAFESPEQVKQTSETKIETEPDIKGEKREASISKRIVENEEKLGEVAKRVKEKGIEYDSVDQKKAKVYAESLISEYEKDNLLHDLADQIINGKSEVPYSAQGLVAAKLIDRMNVAAESDGNEFTKSATFDKAAELSMWWSKEATKAGQFNGVANQEIANSLPTSKEGLRQFAQKETEKLQDQLLTESEKKQITEATEEIANMIDENNLSKEHRAMLESMVTKEIQKITEKLKGKEFVDNLAMALEGLKLDLKDC